MRANVHTWARLIRLDLQSLSISLGNSALAERRKWPGTGEGRAVKATTEEITRLLERTFDRRDLNYSFDVIEEAIALFGSIESNSFFTSHLSTLSYHDRYGRAATYGAVLADSLPKISRHIASNRPERAKATTPSDPGDVLESALPNRELSELVPNQNAAPLQFSVVHGKLKVKRQSARPQSDARHLLSAGKSALQSDATSIIQALTQTNADPRLSVAVSEMREILSSDADIIRLGMMSVSCDALAVRLSDQLPDIVKAKLDSFATNLSLFVNQFPDWQKFVDAASRGSVPSNDDIQLVFRVGSTLADRLKDDDSLVDPHVPTSIKLLLEAIRDPGRSSKRAVFGVVRSIENLISAIFLGFGQAIGAGFAGVKEGTTKAAKAATVVLLLGLAATAATSLAPAAAKMTGSTWLDAAAETVRNAVRSAAP